jgi:hypothetical protein
LKKKVESAPSETAAREGIVISEMVTVSAGCQLVAQATHRNGLVVRSREHHPIQSDSKRVNLAALAIEPGSKTALKHAVIDRVTPHKNVVRNTPAAHVHVSIGPHGK